jgi:hypothetical protein
MSDFTLLIGIEGFEKSRCCAARGMDAIPFPTL